MHLKRLDVAPNAGEGKEQPNRQKNPSRSFEHEVDFRSQSQGGSRQATPEPFKVAGQETSEHENIPENREQDVREPWPQDDIPGPSELSISYNTKVLRVITLKNQAGREVNMFKCRTKIRNSGKPKILFNGGFVGH